MYTYKDRELTKEQVDKLAAEKGVEVDVFLTNNPDIQIQEAVVETTEPEGKTTATETDTSVDAIEVSGTESPLDPGSSGFTEEGEIILSGEEVEEGVVALEPVALEEVVVTGEKKKEKKLEEGYGLDNYLYESFKKGDAYLGESLVSLPGTLFSLAALVSDPVNRALGLPETDVKKFEESIGTRPIIESLIEEQRGLGEKLDVYEKSKNIKGGAYDNFSKGNFSDGFIKLGRGLGESAPISISMMMGGAAGATRLKMISTATPVLAGPELKTQREENPNQSEVENVMKAFSIAGAESFFEGIGSGTLGKVYKDIIFKQGKEKGAETFRTGLISMYETALKKYGVPVSFLGGGIEEVATNTTQNIINGKNAFEGNAEAFTQGVGGGALYGSPINLAKGVNAIKSAISETKVNSILKSSNFELRDVQAAFDPKEFTTEAQVELVKDENTYNVLDSKLKRSVDNGDITNEQADAVRINFRETQGAVNQIKPLKLSTKDQAKAVQLMKEKKQLSNQIKQVGEANLTVEQSDRIKEIDNDLKGIGSKAVTQEVEKVKKAAESIKDLDVQEFASTEETEAFLNEQDQDPKASGQQGFIIQNPKTGKQTIVINREIADREIAVAAPSHEFLHALLFSTVKNSPETQIALGNSLKEYISSIDANKVKDSNFAKRLEQYKSDPDAVQAEEVLTLFSDAIRTEDIKFNETVFTKIGDVVRKALQALGVKVKFNNGKDVYNFIKDYNKSLESTGLTKAQIKAAEGITGKLVADKVKTDEQTIKESRIVSPQATALKDVLSNEELVESIKSPTTEDKFSVAQAIVEKNWPVISKQIDFTPAQQDTAKEVVEEQILGVFQGSGQGKYSPRNTGLFNAFDPSVAQVNTYLGKTIGSRKPEIDLAIKERAGVTGEDLSKAEGITVTESTPAQVDTKKIKPSSLLPSDVVSKVKKEVKEKLKDVPTDKLTFKKLGNLAPEIIAEAIGIPVKKLTDATANLSKSNASAVQRFISQKPETLIKLLPEGAVLEAATQKLMGTSTGVPKSLLDAFYTKQDRTTDPSGLYPFKLNSNLNRANFLEAFGIVDGKKAKDFSPRSAEAQRLKGIASLFGRLVTNEIARTEGDLSLETAKDVAAGKSRLMFSKALKDKPDLLKYFNEELKGLSPGQIVQEIEFLENRAEILGMEQDEAFEQMFTNDNSYKKLRKTLKLKDGGKRNISSKENSKQLKKTHSLFIKGMIPKGKEFKDLPKQTQQFLLDTVGFGDTRITIGDVPLTYKAVTEGVKGYEGLLAKMYGKDILKGTGSDFDFIDVFAPRNWGEKGFRGKVQKIVESNKDNKLKARKEVEKLLTSKDGNVTKTIKANRDALTRAYDVLADIVIKNPSKETISTVADLLESQVNRATGVFKGLVPVTSFNMKPEKGNTKNENKMMHNEHLVELFNANKFFIESLSKFVEGKINESELLNMSRVNAASLEQAVISERMRVEKDASGAAVRDFLNPLTFLGKDAVNQVPIGVESLAVSEQIAQDLEKKQKELVKKASDKKLNSVGVIVKQLLDNNRVYLYTKSKNSDKLSKLIKLSKSETNQEILNIMKSVDDASQKVELKFSKSLDLNKDFNDIIENKTGIASDKTYAKVKAEVAGANKGKFNFFIPPSAEDFVGLLYSTLGEGSTGDAQMAWYKAHLLNPFARAMENLANDRAAMMQDFRGLKKALKIVPKNLRKKIKDSNFTQEQAVRAYIWDQQGMEIPGLSNKDQKDLVDFVSADANLTAFGDQLIAINKGDEYAAPDAGWVAGTIGTDFIKALNTTKRSKYLEVWQQNVDQIFSEANLNKLEAAYGANYREAMVDMLKRMKTGKNTSSGSDRLAARFTDWLTNSVGAIMFFNTRSAVLQTISAVNFINFSDNNVLKAGQAFANQPQYWSDFKKLFNSPFLLDRRSGLKLNVNEADIAAMAKGPGNSARNVIAGILKAGFLPTQLADSFAIASGGASFYRNRIKALQKEGLTEAEAEEQAFRDFREIAEESQQSSRPDKISQQQAGPLGRVVLAFANTPAQYARLIKKAASDLKNGRGDAKTNISKIIYYGVAQNLLFSALQQALFAIAFDDEEEEEKKNEKYFNIVNGMSDSILRGVGVGGAIVSVVKNTALRLAKEADKKSPKYQDAVVKGVLQISPPVSSKVGKLQSAGRSFSWNQEEMRTRGWSIDNPAYLASANVISAATNVPLDRAVKKVTNIVDAGNEDIEYYKRVALALGWSAWELGIDKKGGKVAPPKTDMDKLYDLNKKQQIDSLLSLGISKKQIKALKLEEDRVNAILNPKSIKQIKVSKRDSLFGLNKKDQVKALEKLGLTKKEIRALRLESDRVEAIINKQKKEVE